MTLYDKCCRDQVGPGAPPGGGGGVTTFLGLTDTPGTYVGNEFKFCQVAFDASGLVFSNVWYQSVQANGIVAPFQRANVNFIDGTNTTVTRTDNPGNGSTDVQVNASIIDTFTGLTDTPGSYAGAGLQDVRVNAGATGLEFYDPSYVTVADAGVTRPQQPVLNFVDGTNTTATVTDDPGNNRTNVQIDAAAGVTTFLGLTDTPGSYAGAGLQDVRVNAGATDLEFYDPSYVTVADAGVTRPQQPVLNFVDGTNTTAIVTDDPGNNRTNVQINATGGGGTGTNAVQTMSIAAADANPFMSNNTLGRLYAVAAIPVHDVTANNMAFYCAQNAGGGTFGVGIYDAAGVRLAYSSLSGIVLGLNTVTLDLLGPVNLTGGTIYYFAVESNINACALIGLNSTYNPPIGGGVAPLQFYVPNSRSVDPTGFPANIGAFFGTVGGDSRKYWIAAGP